MNELDREEKIINIEKAMQKVLGNTHILPVITLASVVFCLWQSNSFRVEHIQARNKVRLIVCWKSFYWGMIDSRGCEMNLYDQTEDTINELYNLYF